MLFLFRGYVCAVSKFFSLEPAKADSFPFAHYLGRPIFRLGIPAYSGEARCVVFSRSHVLRILFLRGFSQVRYRVIFSIPVDVVNRFGGHYTMHVKPSKTMRPVQPIVNSYNDVSSTAHAFCNRPYASSTGCEYSRKNTCIGAIVKNLFKSISRNILAAHSVAPFNDWMGRGPLVLAHLRALSFYQEPVTP